MEKIEKGWPVPADDRWSAFAGKTRDRVVE
jgi:hypothetical protein